MENIIRAIRSLYDVDEEALSALTMRLIPLKLSKRQILIRPGKNDAQLYMIEKGITRSYSVIRGKEITSWFSMEGDLTYSTNAFYGSTPGYETETVQALENTLLYHLPLSDFEILCQRYVSLANWQRILYQRAFVEMERRFIYRLYLSAEERYQDFLSLHPDLFQRVNLGHIASFLGMSQVTLCALRKM